MPGWPRHIQTMTGQLEKARDSYLGSSLELAVEEPSVSDLGKEFICLGHGYFGQIFNINIYQNDNSDHHDISWLSLSLTITMIFQDILHDATFKIKITPHIIPHHLFRHLVSPHNRINEQDLRGSDPEGLDLDCCVDESSKFGGEKQAGYLKRLQGLWITWAFLT